MYLPSPTVDEPTAGDARHPRTDEGDALAGEKELIVFVAQRAKDKGAREAGTLGDLDWLRC